MFLFLKCLPRMFIMANKDVRRHFALTFSSVLSIGVALLIAMIMALAALNLGHITEGLEDEFIIQVSIAPSTEDEDIVELQQTISELEGVSSVTFSSKEEELEQLIEENGEIFSQYKKSNPLYDVLIVEMEDSSALESISGRIEKMNNVVKANYGGNMITTMISLMAIGLYLCCCDGIVCGILNSKYDKIGHSSS